MSEMPDDPGADWPPIQFTTAADGSRVSYRLFEGSGPSFVDARSPGTPSISLLPEIYPRAWFDRFRRGRALVFFDWRGSGHSDPVDGDLSIEQLGFDLDAVIDIVGGPVDAVVHNRASFAVSMHAARHSDRYRSITFAPGMLRPDDGLPGFINRPGWQSPYSEYLRGWATEYRLDPEAAIRFALRWASAVPAKSFGTYLASEQDLDLTEVLPSIALPTWVTARQPIDYEASRNVSLLLPDTHLSIYPVTGGAPPFGGRIRDEWDAHLGARLGDPPSAPLRTETGAGDKAPNGVAITPREREVLGLVAKGATNKEVAAELGLSHWTIQRHVSNLLRKTGLKNRRQLMRFADDLEG